MRRAAHEYRRNLPHYQPDHKIFFITFCTFHRWTLPEAARTITLNIILRGNTSRFDLLAAVVMPDHVHLALIPALTPDEPIPIQSIMQALKGTSAHLINKACGRKGRVWQAESFDRALRNEESVETKIFYMLENPVRAGLVSNPLDYPWLWRKTT
jgi:REP element-mobilizing transposase RayT